MPDSAIDPYLQAGILGGTMGQQSGWQNAAGIFGSAMKDAGAYLSGHPADATNVMQYQLMQPKFAAQRLYAAALAPPDQTASPAASVSPASLPRLSQAGASASPLSGLPQISAADSLPKIGDAPQVAAPANTNSGSQSALPSDVANDFAGLSPVGQHLYLQIPHIAGMPARQALSFYLSDPGSYQSAWAKQFEPTDLQKNSNAAFGANTPEAQAALRGNVTKGATVNMRPGGGVANFADGTITTMPNANGVQTTFPQGMNGPASMGLVPGAAPALAGSAYATNAGKAASTPATGYNAAGLPVATNALAMTGAQNVLGLPGQNSTPPAMPSLAPQNLPRIGQPPGTLQQPQQTGSLMPALPANQAPYMAGQGKDASDRHDQTIAEAAGSPDRVNVLDNIINLSKSGVNTGPGSDFQNKVLGYAANTPLLSSLVSDNTKNSLAKFQEIQKFLLQNGQRAWQAAGGTGTDAQLDAASHANPNDAQFPQALQTIAKWVKAGELGVQAKANAQDRYLQQNGNTAQNQISFENSWRNSMDRRVFQLQAMAPQEQQTYIKGLSPQDAATVRAKRQQLMSLGAIQ